MSANGTTEPQESIDAPGKGKGKQIEEPQQHEMMDADDSDSEDSAPEEVEQIEEEDEDNMEEIDTSNIIHSRRTRGKQIDWVEAEQKSKAAGDDLDDDEDDDDDDDFEEPAGEDRMEE